jgi:hypothetical protein
MHVKLLQSNEIDGNIILVCGACLLVFESSLDPISALRSLAGLYEDFHSFWAGFDASLGNSSKL